MKASQLKGMNNKARLIDRQILKGKKAMDLRQKDFDEREQPKKHDIAQRDRPAFPTNARMFDSAQGITKREYFAGMVMQGVLIATDEVGLEQIKKDVAICIRYADELLKQLEPKPE